MQRFHLSLSTLAVAFMGLPAHAQSLPTIREFAPAQGAPGTVVRLQGTGFASMPMDTRAHLRGPLSSQIRVLSDTELEFEILAGQTTFSIWLVAKGVNLAVSQNVFTVIGTPTSKPVAPANFVATGATATSVRLEWKDMSDNEDGFTVWGFARGGRAFPEQRLPAGSTSVVVNGLDPGQEYEARVYSWNVLGISPVRDPAVFWTSKARPNEAAIRIGSLQDPATGGIVPSPLFPSTLRISDDAKLIALHDARADGKVDRAGGFPGQKPDADTVLFPRESIPDLNSRLGHRLVGGRAYARGANLVVYATFSTWSNGRPQFLALHLASDALTGVVRPVVLLAGDLASDAEREGLALMSPPRSDWTFNYRWAVDETGTSRLQGTAATFVWHTMGLSLRASQIEFSFDVKIDWDY